MKKYSILFIFLISTAVPSFSQDDPEKLIIRSVPAGGVVSMLDCENGFGGGNVAASIGPDGVLLVDDMFKAVTPKVIEKIKQSTTAPVRIVINSHYHSDHIEGNSVLSKTATIVAHENLRKRLESGSKWATTESLPHVVFKDKLSIHFNGEEIQLWHLPNGHSDTDVYVYFTKSKVIHMGDTFFHGMFPGVYKEGGGDILQLITNIDKILADLPEDAKVIPGHGDLATKTDLMNYVKMLKETTTLVADGIKANKSLDELKKENLLSKYNKLGEGGAQTTEQYLAMLYKLMSK